LNRLSLIATENFILISGIYPIGSSDNGN